MTIAPETIDILAEVREATMHPRAIPNQTYICDHVPPLGRGFGAGSVSPENLGRNPWTLF